MVRRHSRHLPLINDLVFTVGVTIHRDHLGLADCTTMGLHQGPRVSNPQVVYLMYPTYSILRSVSCEGIHERIYQHTFLCRLLVL